MRLAHGSAITAEEVERIVSREFTPQRFAALCNAIAWTLSRLRCTSLPSFTERVNAKDNGIDAEWQTEFPDDGAYPSPLLGPGWSVFQYKQRDVFAQGREKTFNNLALGLEGAVKDLAKRSGRRPTRYILFTNLDLTHFTKGQKGRLKEKILKGWARSRRVHVEIVGAAELASFLNSAPAVRSAFFVPTRFATWQEAWQRLTRGKLYGANVRLVGRDKELDQLRSLLEDPAVRAIVLAGAQDIGKSRLALQASERRPIDTVVALDPRLMAAGDLLALESPDVETLVIIEDPEEERAEDFVRQALTRERLKVLITLPTAEAAAAASFGRDSRVRVIRLGPLSDSEAQELLGAAGAKLDYGLESWVVHQAGGNPGVLLLAASAGVELRRSAASFTEDVARAFERKVTRVLGEAAIRILRILSLLTHVGIGGTGAKELELACQLFGDGVDSNAVLNALPRLTDAGVVRLGGAYAEVVPPLLANSLASAAFRGHFTDLCALFGALSQAGRLRLIRRLRGLRSEEATRFWDELFGADGPFRDLPSALSNSHLLRLIAGTIPERVARLVGESLEGATPEERLAIAGEARRELMWTLEELLFRRKTSRVALRSLALLAEAENETYGSNATGVFCAVFHPLHPQMPLPLEDRLDCLRDLLGDRYSSRMHLVVVEAIATALGRGGVVPLRRSEGPEPLDSRPSLTYGEVFNYMEALVDLLMEVARSGNPEVAQSAGRALPHAIAECAIQGRPEQAVARFKAVAQWVASAQEPVSVSGLVDALAFVQAAFERQKGEKGPDVATRLKGPLEEVRGLVAALDRGDFATRLRRWAGKWTRDDHEYEEEDGQRIYRSVKELRRLAREALDDSAILTDDLLAWLCSGEAQKAHLFFWWLGRLDSGQRWRSKIEQLGADRGGSVVFAAYFGGLGQIDRAFVSRRLDELTTARSVLGEAIVSATGYLGGDAARAARVESLLREDRVDPGFAARILSGGGWINSLGPEDYLRLLKAIAGPGLEHAPAVIDFLGMWLHGRRPVEGDLAEFAWRCLESRAPATQNEAYDCDQLGAHLAEGDSERGLRLLETLLTGPYQSESWNPLEHYGERRFWSALLNAHRERALRLVLSLALRDPMAKFHITWHLREVLDQDRDADILIGFALEDERQGELISSTVTAGRPGFWPIALKIVEAYPRNERIQGALASATEHMGLMIRGPQSAHYEACRREVEHVRLDPATRAAARPWLQRVEEYLRQQSERELLSEIEREVNDLRRVVEDPAAPERVWAITALLRLGKAEKVIRLIPKEEMVKILPKLDIPAKQKQKIRRMLDAAT